MVESYYTSKLVCRKSLSFFQMDQANPLAVPMIGRSKTNDDPYQPREQEEEEIVDKPRCLTAVGALTYLITRTRTDIAFATSTTRNCVQSRHGI